LHIHILPRWSGDKFRFIWPQQKLSEEKMTEIKDMTDKELKDEYLAYYESIYIVECYSARDMMWLDALGRELHRRGFTITQGQPVISEKPQFACEECNHTIVEGEVGDCETCDQILCDSCIEQHQEQGHNATLRNPETLK